MMMKGQLWERRRAATGALLLLLLALMTGACGGSLYKVKPVVEAPVTAPTGAASAGGFQLRAAPLLTDEESQQLFEANLLLAGLLPVRVEMTNESGASLLFKRVRFRLRDQSGKEWKYRTARQAVARILDSNQVYLYNPNSRAAFETAFRAHTFDTGEPLAASQSRRGLLFFQTPKKEAVESPRSLVLVVEGLPQPLELKLK
ncbi:MAG: hypothetical protein QOF02_2614 [Blastocatellia bacterium]|jgi:hypothetical protein|nr:hypothetical protein [Blastocatellia bacterium]